MTSSLTLPGCLVHALVRGFLENGEPVGMLPGGRLARSVKPRVCCLARTPKGGDNLRGRKFGKRFVELHGANIPAKNNSAMQKIILAKCPQCRHIERMNKPAMTPELINYAKTIVAERGIKQADMTQAIMGEILKEALLRMDHAMTRFLDNKEAQTGMAEGIFYGVKIS